MAKHYNTTLTELWNRIFNPKGEFPSSELLPYLTPTVELRPTSDIFRAANATASGTTTIFTTPSDKDFFLVGGYLTSSYDATADSIFTQLRFTDGLGVANRVLLDHRKITTTATNEATAFTTAFPIKVARNTAITMVTSFTVGTSACAAGIHGYTIETTKGT